MQQQKQQQQCSQLVVLFQTTPPCSLQPCHVESESLLLQSEQQRDNSNGMLRNCREPSAAWAVLGCGLCLGRGR